MYAIYDIKDNDICVGIYEKVIDIAKSLDISDNHVSSIISKKTLYKSRYRIERIDAIESDLIS